MNKSRQLAIALVSSVLFIPVTAKADSRSYTCTYTHASYTAPFMKQPSIRNCPEGRCSYQINFTNSVGSINGVSGFDVSDTETFIRFSRTAKDPVMGGMDTTVLTIQKSDMSFENVKTTTPNVTLKTQGHCS